VVYIYSLLTLILILLLVVVYLNIKNKNEVSSQESFKELDKSIEKQEAKINELSKDIQFFHTPLEKLNRYLSGSSLAGKFGEWGLESIIRDILPESKFKQNIEVIKGSGKRVEFAIKMDDGLLLPIDAKFPSGLYDNYLQAVKDSNSEEIKRAVDAIRRHLISEASEINTKYIQSGITLDLGIMFIPSESLMQLIDSIEEIRKNIFRDNRVLIMGPNSMSAYLISIHMSFRTIALNERASDIMKEFGKLKKEFEKFKGSTEDLEKKADAMLKAINEHSVRERQMNKALRNMDQLDN